MTNIAVIDTTDLSVTPLFKIMELENIPKSEIEGRLVLETMEMVEVRIAGDKNYAPCFPAHAAWRREGNRTITYAERWADAYRNFKEGDPQEAMGTPLEMLREYGVTPELISLCRALKIYSVEALARLEERGVKALGMNANTLKAAATKFLAGRMSGEQAAQQIAELRAEVETLRAAGAGQVPEEQPAPEEIDELVAAADAAMAALTDAEIKDKIAELNDGKRPVGNPNRATLESSLRELQAA